MLFSMSGTPVYAADVEMGASAVCPHHVHDETCGYSEGTPCTHEHTDDCYTLVTECVHEHTAECYPADGDGDDTVTPSDADVKEPTACTHVCSVESGCITKELNCPHVHDETCGYSEGSPCTFDPADCELCNSQENPAEQTVTAWEWIGADSLNEGVLLLSGASAENPVDFDTVVSLLPTGITATVDGSEEPVELALTWSCEGFPEQAAEGEYTFTAELPEGYTLAADAASLAVSVILGGGTTLDGNGQPDGEGTKESPYQISTADELFWFASLVNGTLEGVEQNTAACAVLTADINLSGQTWTPIGTSTRNYFEGTFDGDGHTISNLTIDTNASYVGLFGATSGATLKNVTLDEPQVQNSAGGTSNTGALVGYMVGNGTVKYCAVTNGSVSSAGQYVGGLIGYILGGTVQYCYNLETEVDSSYSPKTYVNGVAGRTGNYTYLCSSFSYVSSKKELKASNTANYAAYLSDTPMERVYGKSGDQYGFSAEQFEDGTVAYFLRTGFYGGEAKYPDWGQTIETDTLPKWKGEAVESLQYGRLGSDGKAEDTYAYFNALTQGTDGTYHIEDTSDWIAFVKLVKVDEKYNANAVVKECAVIDFSQFGTLTNKSTYSYLVIADCFSDEPYTGTFIGNGCTVKGVSYSGTMEFALFGTIGEGGSVSGITLETPEITGTTAGAYNIAGIASHNYGIIDDCHVDGGTISTVTTTAAGIVAESFGTVKNCTNSADITAKYQVAGIVATSNSTSSHTSAEDPMVIEGCSNSGTITATNAGSSCAGGIFGGKDPFSGGTYPYGTISKCFNTGNILGQSYIGGIVGYSIKNANASAANVTIENCYNTGAIGDDRTTGVAGGISAGTNSSVTNCFNVGAVTGTNAQPIVANGYNTQAWSVNSCASCDVTGPSMNTTLYYGEDDGNQAWPKDEQGRYCRGSGKRTDAEMASGEVAYLLQQGQSDSEQVWSQQIGVDDHPVLVSDGKPVPVVQITVKLVDDGETVTELTKCYTNAGSTLSAYPKPDDQGAVYTFYTDTSCTETNKIDTATKTYSTDTTIYVKQSKLPDLEGTVTIAGTPKTGEKLTAITNGITSENLGELRYQWYRCNGDDDSNPEAISEATSNTYTVTKADTGKYIKVVVTADNYSGSLSATTSQVQANPATVSTAPAAKDNLVYTGSAQALVTAGSAEGGTMMYRLGNSGDFSADIPTGTNAGDYSVWYKVVGDENHSDTQPVKVDVTIAKATPDYTVPTGLTATYGNTLNDVTLTSGWTWDDAVTTSVGNVGENTFSATFTPSDTTNYNTVTENLTVTVSAKDISNAVITLGDSLTYTGQVQTQQIASVTVDGLTVTYTVTGNTGTGAGDYTLTITGTGNFTGTATKEWTIAKANYNGATDVSGTVLANWPDKVTLPTIPAGASYGAASYDGSDGAVKDLSIEGGVLHYTGGSDVTSGGTYTITVPVTGATNYVDYNIAVTLTGSDKQTLTITGVTAQDGSYNGQTQAGYTGTPSAEGYDGGFTVTYSTTDDKAPTDAGTYTVTIAIPEDNAQYVGSIGLNFTIAKKALTVSAPSASVYVGDSAPKLALTYTGLVAGESVTPSEDPVFTITKADGTVIALEDAVKTAGTYIITWSNANQDFSGADNYAITLTTTGTLTVSNRSSGGTTTYPVQVEENSQNGGVQVLPKNAVPGTLVTVTPQPAPGYELATLTVLDQYGNEVDVNPLGNGNYSFKMPRSRVKVEATFYCTGSELCPTHHLADVLVKAWYHDAVDYVVEHGIMTGTSATTFEPNTTLSRAMVAQILYNLEGQPTVTGESTFTDVSGHWAIDAITWAQKTGVVDGYEDNTFRPENNVTRQEFAQMMYNYAAYKDYDLSAKGDLSQFTDGDSVQEWAVTAMSWANGNALINGHDDGTLEPGGTTTRAQAASILMRFDQNLVEN